MPFLDIHSSDDYASIYYATNTPRGNVGGFKPDRPSIILLHPLFMDSTWLHQQFGDPRLDSTYNMIAFDMRVCGKSHARPNARHDSWVDAADLAYCHQKLHLPPCHIMAIEGISINCALRFAVLFPEMCLSLTLCNIPAPTEMKWVLTAYEELLHSWRHAEDLETFEHVAKESAAFVVGPQCDPDLLDELIAFWETTMPPVQILRLSEIQNVLGNRKPLKPEVLGSITQPVLLIRGELNETCSRAYTEKLASQLVNSRGGAINFTVRGGSGALSVKPGNASMVNRVFASFLSRLPFVGSRLIPPQIERRERMKTALASLADIVGDGSIATRDPMSSLSFNCLPEDAVQRQTDTLKQYRQGLWTAYSPLGPDGRPFRKYSDKKSDHWFHSEKDGLSIAGNNFLPPEQVKEHEREHFEKPLPSQEPSSDIRIRRTNINSTSMEKPVTKGSMVKVINTATAQVQV